MQQCGQQMIQVCEYRQSKVEITKNVSMYNKRYRLKFNVSFCKILMNEQFHGSWTKDLTYISLESANAVSRVGAIALQGRRSLLLTSLTVGKGNDLKNID